MIIIWDDGYFSIVNTWDDAIAIAIVVPFTGTYITLHAFADDFNLNAIWDTERRATILSYPTYLTDPSGNRLTDPSGNYLVTMEASTYYLQVLHALADDFNLNAEKL